MWIVGVKSISLNNFEEWIHQLISFNPTKFNVDKFSLEKLLDKLQDYYDGK